MHGSPHDGAAVTTTAPIALAALPASASTASPQPHPVAPPPLASVGSSASPNVAPPRHRRRLNPDPPPEPASPPAEIDPVRGRRLGTTEWHSKDFVTPAQLPELWARLEPLPRIDMVVKVLKNRIPRQKTGLDYRTMLVDTGDGTETIMRATRDSVLWLEAGWQPVLEPGTIVVLRNLDLSWDKAKVDPIRCQ